MLQEHMRASELTSVVPTLCDPMDWSLRGSSVHGILQARAPECPPPGDLPARGLDPPHLLCLLHWQGDFYHWSESGSCSAVSNSLWPHGIYSPRNSPGQNTGVGSLYLLQRIFLTQGSNPGLLHCRQILYHLSHKGSPRLPQWVAIPFSSGISQPRNWTGVFCIAGGFFTNWTITTSTTWKVYQIYHLKYLLSSCS